MPIYIETLTDPVRDGVAQVAIATVLALILLDVVVGLTGALVTHTFSSEKMRNGLLHKFTEMACVALAIVLDGALMGGVDFFVPEPVLLSTCGYIGMMEVGSFLELVKQYNPDLAGPLGFLTQFVSQKGGE